MACRFLPATDVLASLMVVLMVVYNVYNGQTELMNREWLDALDDGRFETDGR